MNIRLKNELKTKTSQTSATRERSDRFAPTKVETITEISLGTLIAQANHDSDQGGRGEDSGDDGTGTATISKPKSKTKTPSLYRVILINDDFTPMEFVIHILQKFFQKEYTEATQIMLQVHNQGAGVCGVFTYEIAEMKVYLVNQYSRENRHPLKCTMERA